MRRPEQAGRRSLLGSHQRGGHGTSRVRQALLLRVLRSISGDARRERVPCWSCPPPSWGRDRADRRAAFTRVGEPGWQALARPVRCATMTCQDCGAVRCQPCEAALVQLYVQTGAVSEPESIRPRRRRTPFDPDLVPPPEVPRGASVGHESAGLRHSPGVHRRRL